MIPRLFCEFQKKKKFVFTGNICERTELEDILSFYRGYYVIGQIKNWNADKTIIIIKKEKASTSTARAFFQSRSI